MADSIKEFLQHRSEEGLLRVLRPQAGPAQTNFSSNDYLGLSLHPKLKEAGQKAIADFGVGAGASRLMSGDSALFHRLEEKIAVFKNKEAALVFNSGYQANIGIISALYQKGDCIFSDRLNHASILDGITFSQARFFRFQHNDAGHLRQLLEKERLKFKNALIVTESVFSMDGDKAPLKELVSLKEEFNCRIMVDEAHATGIFGEHGTGVVEEEDLAEKVDLIMGTFSKALASFGAYVAAPREIIDYLVNTCRSFIYSTALPPAVIAVNLAGLDLIEAESWRRKTLLENAAYFRQELVKRDFQVRGSSQIIPLIVGSNTAAVKFSQALQQKGYFVLPIRPPTVPKGEARLRFSLTVNHSREILQKLVDDISKVKI